MSTRRLCFSIASFAMVVALAQTAHADDALAGPTSAEARKHFTAGNRLYRRVRDFEGAIEQYKAGVLKEEAPVFHYNLGQCYRMLGRHADAIWHYERFLKLANPTGDVRDAVDRFLRQLKDELAKKAMPQSPPAPAPAPRPPAPPVRRDQALLIHRAEPWHGDRLGWGLAGAGAIGAGISVALLLNAEGLEAESNDELGHAARIELRERARDRRIAGAVIGLAGGAALVAGVIKLAIHGEHREHMLMTSLELGSSRAGVVIMGRF